MRVWPVLSPSGYPAPCVTSRGGRRSARCLGATTMNRRKLLWAATAMIAAQLEFDCCAAFAQGDTGKRLLGTWRLVDVRNDKGEQIRGPKPSGVLFYDAAGNMAVQIMPDWERPKFALGKATPEQAKAAIDAYSAYFGPYSMDEKNATNKDNPRG